MAEYVVPLAFLMFAIGAAAMFLWRRERIRKLTRALEKQAELHKGELKPATLISYPRMKFVHGTSEFTASVEPARGSMRSGDHRPPFSFVRAIVDARPDFDLGFRKAMITGFFDPLPGEKNIMTGNREFDDRFTLRASHEDRARRVIDRDLRDRLLALPLGEDIRISVGTFDTYWDGDSNPETRGSPLTVFVPRLTLDDEVWDTLIEIAVEVHDRLVK